MVRDVLSKLSVDPSTDVCEIGCGTGLLAVPIAERAHFFVGVDFAEAAVAVLDGKLAERGLGAKTKSVTMDFASATAEDLAALGTFDRVLVYATLHLVGDDAETRLFFDRAVALLRPGGLALFGNLPLADRVSITRPSLWKVQAFALRAWRKAGRLIRRDHRVGPTVSGLAPLRGALLELWCRDADAMFRWELPAVGTPIFTTRLDLLIEKASQVA